MDEKLQHGDRAQVNIVPASNAEPHTSGSGRFRQYLATIIVNLLSFGFGTSVGWPAMVQATLESEESPLGVKLDEAEFSWLASLVFVGGLCGCQLWGRLADRWGRKGAGLAVAVPPALGWLLALSAPGLGYLYAARFLLGFGGSGCFVLCPIYVAEVAEDAVRGTLGSYTILSMNAGVLAAYALGSALPYYWFTSACLVPPLLFLGLFWWLPETPSHLWTRNRREEAEKSLYWFRGGNRSLVRLECGKLESVIRQDEPQPFRMLVAHGGTRRAMIIGLALFTVQQYCGILAILTYLVQIFKVSGSSVNPSTATIALGLIQLIASYISSVTVDRLGRRILLLTSCGFMCLSLALLGIYFWYLDSGNDVSLYGWVPMASLAVYVCAYALAAGPIPYVIISETFAPKLRGLVTSILVFWGTSLVFSTVKLFPYLTSTLGNCGCYWFFGAFCAFGFVFTLVYIPETKGRPLKDILTQLNGENECSSIDEETLKF